MQTLQHTNIYWYIWWLKFVINTLIFENAFKKQYINIVSSRYNFAEQMYQKQSSSVFLQ